MLKDLEVIRDTGFMTQVKAVGPGTKTVSSGWDEVGGGGEHVCRGS